jgi:hypothetical protein
MKTYNLFCRRGRAELVCAVPEDRPVPAFITALNWEFGGKLENADRDPHAFNHEAAGASVRVNGFYLFQMTKPLNVSFPDQQAQGGSTLLAAASKAPARAMPPQAKCRPGDRARLPRTRVPIGLTCAF